MLYFAIKKGCLKCLNDTRGKSSRSIVLSSIQYSKENETRELMLSYKEAVCLFMVCYTFKSCWPWPIPGRMDPLGWWAERKRKGMRKKKRDRGDTVGRITTAKRGVPFKKKGVWGLGRKQQRRERKGHSGVHKTERRERERRVGERLRDTEGEDRKQLSLHLLRGAGGVYGSVSQSGRQADTLARRLPALPHALTPMTLLCVCVHRWQTLWHRCAVWSWRRWWWPTLRDAVSSVSMHFNLLQVCLPHLLLLLLWAEASALPAPPGRTREFTPSVLMKQMLFDSHFSCLSTFLYSTLPPLLLSNVLLLPSSSSPPVLQHHVLPLLDYFSLFLFSTLLNSVLLNLNNFIASYIQLTLSSMHNSDLHAVWNKKKSRNLFCCCCSFGIYLTLGGYKVKFAAWFFCVLFGASWAPVAGFSLRGQRCHRKKNKRKRERELHLWESSAGICASLPHLRRNNSSPESACRPSLRGAVILATLPRLLP